MTQRPCQHDAIDSARRGSRYDVNDDPQIDRSTDIAQQIEIDRFGVEFGIGAVANIEECCGRAFFPVGDGMKGAGRPGEFQNLLGDPMHIDSERGAAETNKRYPEFLFAQDCSPS